MKRLFLGLALVLMAGRASAQQPVDVTDRSGRDVGHVTVDTAPTTAVTNAGLTELDIALSALRDAIIGAGPKTLTDVVTALGSLTVAISGSVAVTGPLTDTQLRATPVPVSGTVTASGPLTDTQLRATPVPVSGTVTASGPLTDTQLRATAVPVDGSGVTQPVSGTFWQATQPVSGTFYQVTQPVSIASMPSTPVTGTFYQVTQPVSIADGSSVTLGAKADAASTATDTTPISIVSVLKEISAKAQAPASTPVTGTFYQVTQPVSLASAPTTAVTNASLDGTTIATLDADVKANVTLHAGTNVIGHVIVDTAPSTAVTNANLDVALSTLATASAQTTGNGSLATIATNSGTQATAANQTTGNNSLSTIATNTGNGATSANQTTELASLATIAGAVHNEDAPAVDGEAGIKVLGRRNDAGAILTSADGDEGGIVVDPHGHLVTKLAGRDAGGNENITSVSPGGALLTVSVATRLAWPCNALRRTNCR